MKIKLYLALLVVLLSGMSIGFFFGQYYDRQRMHQLMKRGPERFEEMIMDRLVRQLDLGGDQKAAVKEKVIMMVGEIESEHQKHGEEMRARMTRLLADIRPLLEERQQKLLDTMDAEDLRPGPPPPLPPNGARSLMDDDMGKEHPPGDFHGSGMPSGRP